MTTNKHNNVNNILFKKKKPTAEEREAFAEKVDAEHEFRKTSLNSLNPGGDEKGKVTRVRATVDLREETHDAMKLYLIKNKKFKKIAPFMEFLIERELGIVDNNNIKIIKS